MAKYPKSIHKMAAKNASRFLKTLLLTFLTRPNGQEKLEEILLCQLRKCVDETALNTLDEESNTLSKKNKRELLKVSVDEESILKNT